MLVIHHAGEPIALYGPDYWRQCDAVRPARRAWGRYVLGALLLVGAVWAWRFW